MENDTNPHNHWCFSVENPVDSVDCNFMVIELKYFLRSISATEFSDRADLKGIYRIWENARDSIFCRDIPDNGKNPPSGFAVQFFAGQALFYTDPYFL